MWFKKQAIFLKGVSTVELIVTIAIFVLISVAILVSYPQLSNQLSLDKTAQEIASSIHETRMYGIGIKSAGSGSVKTKGYGVHFTRDYQNLYTLFSELPIPGENGDKQYTIVSGDEVEKVLDYKINSREKISDVCVLNSDDNGSGCNVAGVNLNCFSTDPQMKSVDVLFLRPAPTVFIKGFKGVSLSSVCDPAETCAQAVIVIKSPTNKCKKIKIWTTGQVDVVSQNP